MQVRFCLFLLCLLVVLDLHSQSSEATRFQKTNVLRQKLAVAKSDTERVKLRYELANLNADNTRLYQWDSLAKEAHRLELTGIETKALTKLALVYETMGDSLRFVQTCEKAIPIAADLKDYSSELSLLYHLGSFLVIKQDLTRGLDLCFTGLKLAEELKNKVFIGKFNSAVATAYWFLGDYKKVLDYNNQNLKVYRDLGDTNNLAQTLLSIGDAYTLVPDTPKIIEFYMAAGKLVNLKYGKPFCAHLYKSVGVAHMVKKQFDSSNYYFDKSFQLYEATGSKNGMASDLVLKAISYYHWGKNKEALETGLRALKLCNQIHFKVQIPVLADILEKIYARAGNYKEALIYYKLAVTTRDSIQSNENRSLAIRKETNYQLEKKENENKLLAQQNRIQSLELKQNSYLYGSIIVVTLLLLIVSYLFSRKTKVEAQQKNSRLEHKLLLSQMNPHFIFNSLQTVQNYILKRNEDDAVKYLSYFGAITREVLENSRLETIPLKKEIHLLQNYLSLQHLRFKNKFEYAIDIDENLDLENIRIPPMLSQPFIENAIEHGFHGIEGDANLWIKFYLQGTHLCIEIVDNGLGMKDNYSKHKKHVSLAMEITRERVSLLNEKQNGKVRFEISEGFPSNKERPGVAVRFTLPL